jgi:predicted esterase
MPRSAASFLFRAIAILIVFLSVMALRAVFSHIESAAAEASADYKAACHGPKLRTIEARNKAMEDGYDINRLHDCIDKSSFAAVVDAKTKWEAANTPDAKARATAERAQKIALEDTLKPTTVQTLAQARDGFETRNVDKSGRPEPLPNPPASLFVRTDYKSTANLVLPAFVTPNPKDGKKHPAIIWLTGGDTNSLSDFWSPQPANNDQTASAFRKAGIVMMFPTLRGGNTNPGNKELFYGEVDDVVAATEHLASLPYIDRNQIYLGGHSTGGTLVLLTAEMGERLNGRIRAVFSFGPIGHIEQYQWMQSLQRLIQQSDPEGKLRSPFYWLHGVAVPTYLIEGTESPNLDELDAMCKKSSNPQLHCIRANGMSHFSVIDAVSKVIAARIVMGSTGLAFELNSDQFAGK